MNYINSRKTTVVVKNNTYLYNLILRQLGSHKDYEKVKAVIQININNYDYFKKNEFVYVSRMIEEKHHLVRDDMIKIVDINLPYLEKIDYNNIKKGKEFDLEKLLYIFVCDDKNILDQVYDGDEIMKKVIEDEEVFMDVMDSLLYYKYEDLLTEEEKEEFYKKQEEAKEQGRIETQKEIVKNMQEAGISDDVIFKSLNIDQEMLNKLKKK